MLSRVEYIVATVRISVNKVNHDMQAQFYCAQNYASNAYLATGSNQFDLIIPLALLEL